MQTEARFNESRAYGIELEVLSQYSAGYVAIKLTEAGIPTQAEGYNHNLSNAWKIVPDGSLPRNGIELVSPKLYGTDGLNQIKTVCEVLNSLTYGGRKTISVNRACGFHVHHNAADLTKTQYSNIISLTTRVQPFINLLLPERIGSRWCKQVTFDLIKQNQRRNISLLLGGDRYYVVNASAYDRHRTIEFRSHTGTTNYEKIAAWVIFTQNIINAAISKKSVTKAPFSINNSIVEHALYTLGSDKNCEYTKMARKNIVRRIYAKQVRSITGFRGFGSAKRYLTPQQRREVVRRHDRFTIVVSI